MKNLASWQVIAMNIAAVGTAISFAKFIFLPHTKDRRTKTKAGFWIAVIFLLTGLFVANIVYLQAYEITNITKALVTIAVGWLAYHFIFKKLSISLPRVFEEFEHLIGVMSLTLILLFWMAFA